MYCTYIYTGSRNVAPLIVNLGLVVHITPQPLIPGKNTGTH